MTSVDAALALIKKGASGASCSKDLATSPWEFDNGSPNYGPGASENDPIPATSPVQGALPDEYRQASQDELVERVWNAKHKLGERLTILGHFYQRDEVVQFADFVGDSFQLAQQSKTRPSAEAILFCGVHFMAETADLLSRPDQAVILPNLAAGCSMADMADGPSVENAWTQLQAATNETIIPVTYMNSSAALKAFCGRNGGIVCTSSNADKVLKWAFERGSKILFFPDQHLGRNTARAMGISLDEMPLWDPRKPLGGNTNESIANAKVILWRGWCSVHKRFNVGQIEKARREFPDVRVIVHPECPMEVVEAADEYGSTNYILKAVENAAPGTTFAIGTEINMVNRLAAEHPEHTIFCLDPVICPCSTMYRIHPAYLAWTMEALLQGEILNRIEVPSAVADDARLALERMLEVAQ